MAWRAIQDTVGRSVSLASVSDLAERIYFRLLACSNPYGRLQGHPMKVRALCFPLLEIKNTDAGVALTELADVGRIVAYEVDGEACIAIVDFDENQPKEAYKRRGESKIPPPPEPVENQRELLERLWGVTPEHSGSKWKDPANEYDSRTSRNLSGGDEKETRRDIHPEAVTGTSNAADDDEPRVTPAANGPGQAQHLQAQVTASLRTI